MICADTIFIHKPTKFFFASVLLFLLIGIGVVDGATRYSVASGNWNATSTWSIASGGASGASAPVAGDVVYIEGNRTVTIGANAACTNVSIAGGSTLNVGGFNFTVSGTTTVSGAIIHTSATGTKSYGDVIIFGGTWTSNATETYAINNLTLSGSTINGSSTGIINVGAILFVTAGTTNTFNALTITVSGTTTINGSLVVASTAGTKTFIGQTTIGSGGIWDNDNVNEAIIFRGGLTNNGIFYAGSSAYTFNTNPQAIGGTLSIPNITVTGITLTNNAKLTVGTALSGTGGFTQSATSTLNLGGTCGITTFTASAVGNTVNYIGAAQTVDPATYSNLTLSGSGQKTTAGVNVNGILSLEGTATVSASPTYGTAATLQYNTTTARTAGLEWVSPFTATGGIVIANTGAITLNSAEVLNTSVPLTVSSGATLSMSTFLLTLNGNLVNNGGTVSGTTGGVTIAGTATQSIGSFTTTGTVSMTKTAGTATFMGNINAAGLTLNGTGGTLNLGAGLTHTFTGVSTITAGTLNGGSSLLRLGGSVSGAGGTFTAGTGTVEWNAAGAQTVAAVAYNNLIFSGSGIKSVTTGTSVTGNLSISGATAGIGAGLNISAGSLTMGGVNKINGTWGSTNSSATNKDNTYFAATTGYITVTTDTRPTSAISGITASQSICYGTATITLTGTVSSGAAYPVSGETVGVTINGATQNATIAGSVGGFSITYSTPLIPSSATPYTITYSYAGGVNLKAAANNTGTTLTVNPSTVISGQSTATQTQCFNGIFTAVSVTATGTGTITYQWYSNTTASTTGGTLLAGATNASYTPLATTAGTLYYYCLVNGTCGSITSTISGAFIVNPATAINSQSTATQTQCIGGAFTAISVTAIGTGTITYQWYSNTTAGTTGGTLLAGATNASYTPLATATGTLYYYCIVHSNCGANITSAISGAFVVNSIPAQPGIITGSTNACQASSQTYSVTNVNGVTFNWTFPSGWTQTAGGTTNSVTVTVGAGAGNVQVIPSNMCGNGTARTLAVISSTSVGGTLSGGTSPLCLGSATGTITLSGYTGTIVQWERQVNSGGWTNIYNGGNATLSESPWSAGVWQYRVAVQNGSCSIAYSSVISITVDPTSVGGWISGSSTPVCMGSNTGTFTVNGSTGNVVRWERRLNSGAWENIANTLITYSEVPTSGGTWEYRALLQSGSCPALYATSFSITVNPTLTITLGTNPVICSGATTALLPYSVTTGSPAAYSISFDAAAKSAGMGDVSGSGLDASPIQINVPYNIAAGVYNGTLSVATTYPVCSSVGYPITITVNSATAISSQSTATQTQCLNGTFSAISITATGTGTTTYQWYKNTTASTTGGTLLTGATNASYTPLATATGTLYYYCVVHSNCGADITSAISGAFIITAISNITIPTAIAGNANAVLSWTNPTSCYDEIMIVAKAGSSVSGTPGGDGSAYTASLAYGSGTLFTGGGYVVYRGTASPQTITSLINGTQNYFKFFTRKGNTWSSGVETNATPTDVSLASDYFRTKATGNWNAIATWESSHDGTNWFYSTLTPASTANTITIQNAHIVTVNAAVTVDQVTVNAGGQVTVNTGQVLTIANGTGTDMMVNGMLVNSGTITTTGTLAFGVGGTYQHALNGGTIPTAVWDAASTCNITGVIATLPGTASFAQSFGNFTWNCLSQTGDLSLAQNLTTINGNLSINSTGTGSLRLVNGNGNGTITVAGNYSQTGGILYICGTSNPSTLSLIVVRDFSLATGTLYINGQTGTSILNVAGNFAMNSGTITEVSTGTSNINFNGTTTQTFSKTGGAISNSVNFSILSNSIVDFGTSILDDDATNVATFNLNTGGTIITANTNTIGALTTTGANGSIQVGGLRTYNAAANYNFDGTSAQNTGNGLVGANNLTINNSSGVTLTSSTTISGILNLTSGILTTGANTVTLTNNSTSAVTGGSTTNFVNGALIWQLASGQTYSFPIGKGITYLPFGLTGITGTTPRIRVEAFTANAGGIATLPLGTLSNTEYWLASITSGTYTNGSVSLTRQTALDGLDAIGISSSLTGNYSSLNGTVSNTSILNSDPTGNSSGYFVMAAKRSITTSALSVSSFCAGGSVSVPFTIMGTFTSGNIFKAQLSDASGSFTVPVTLGTITSVAAGTISGTIPVSTAEGTGYRIRVISSTPAATGIDNGSNLTITATLAQPGTITGSATPCRASSQVYSVANVTGVTYTWTFPAGWVQTSGGTTNSVVVTVGSGSGNVLVTPSNACGIGTPRTLAVALALTSATPAATGAIICVGSTAILSASGAVAGDKYVWYDAVLNGNLLKTSTDNTDNTFTTPVLAATTNYWVSILNAGGCESTRTQVIATYPSASPDDQNAAGTNSWIGHVYDGLNLDTYIGHYTESETFDQSFGGDYNCFNVTSNSSARSIYTETFSVRYRMNSNKKGLYVVDMGADDGIRLSVDGTLIFNNWVDQAYTSRPIVLMNLNGASSLVYDYYENGGANRVVFQNQTLLLSNTLTTNLSQSIFVGSTGSAISGDVFGTLPTGITLNGTGYQWTYSTTPLGARTNISGATGATYSPDASGAPFNVPGTYYIYRNATLSSANNVNPNPYIATNESNATTLIINNVPLIATSTTTLTGFSYTFGSGPSAQQSFTVGGTYLIANITVTPSTNFEISTTSGSGFISTPITLTQTAGTVATTTIYIRLKAGLAVGTYASENIASSSTGATTQNVVCSGTVVNVPLITTSATTLTGFAYNIGSGPSAQQSFTIVGTYLTANITVTPSADFEISTTSGSGFVSVPVTLTQTAGTVATTTIYVRLKAGLAVGTYASENIVSSSTGAIAKNVACSGTVVTAPLITTSTTALTGFTYIVGSGPSAQQSFTVSGTYLTTNIAVTPSTNFEISTTSGSGFVSTPITLTQTAGNVATTTIYVRLKTGLAVGTYAAENIASSSTGATTQNVVCSGTVVNLPLITASATTLTGFTYNIGYGPSAQQSFTVSGSYLIASLLVTPPTDFEISTVSGSGFAATPITLTPTSGTVATTTIYVRLKAGLAVGSYATENITMTSASAVTKNVICSGTVGNGPTIVSSVTTLSGFSYTAGAGPSAQQAFNVSGVNLTANITITPSTDYEISTTSGTSFVATSSITLTQTAGSVSATPIYVRLKTGLTGGIYSGENIVLTSSNATTQNVVCSGMVNGYVQIWKAGTYQASYATLKDAFDVINAGTIIGTLDIKINGSIADNRSATLYQSGYTGAGGTSNYSSVKIYPTVSGLTLSGNLAAPLIDLNGADNVTIDGSVNALGSTKSLTITNTSILATAGTSTIRFINSAENNVLKYCTVKGSEMSLTSGVIFFSTATAGNGNDGNTIDNNDITSNTTGRPINAIYSAGTASYENSGNIIQNNNIFDFWNTGASSAAIQLASNTTDITISLNSFYETTSFLPTGAFNYRMLYINTTGNNFTVFNNYFGGQATQCGGTALLLGTTGNVLITLDPIQISAGATAASSIQGNIIKNITFRSSIQLAPAISFRAINLVAGLLNIGNESGNIIGSDTGIGSITVNSNVTGGNVYGIYIASPNDVDCRNNVIGSITTANTNVANATNLFGIYKTATTGTTTISNNTIGSLTTANSLNTSSTATTSSQSLICIYSGGIGNTTISGNTIANITNSTTETTYASRLRGILTEGGSNNINNNEVHHLKSGGAANGANYPNTSLIGISQVGTTAGTTQNVSDNSVYNLTNTATVKMEMYGIYYDGPTSGTNTISRNFVHSYYINSTDAAYLHGISLYGGAFTASNNIVYLGSTISTGCSMWAMWTNSTNSIRIYHNTLYLGGTATSGSSNTYAFRSLNAGPTDAIIKNNIIWNARTNSSNVISHYAIYLQSSANTSVDYNDFRFYQQFGIIGATTYTSFAAWKTGTGFDTNSTEADPQLVNLGGTLPTDYQTSVPLDGVPGTGILTDYNNIVRSTIAPTMGAWEYFSNPVEVWNGTTFRKGYTTLKDAFDKINDGTWTGDLIIKFKGNTIETASAVLNASGTGVSSYTKILIYPSRYGVTVTGSLAAPLVDLNGSDNVTFDGRIDGAGTTSEITYSNTSTSGVAGTSTFRFINDATNNTIKYCTIKGSSTDAGAGVVFISTTAGTTGNDGNTIDHNSITNSADANRPLNAIYSSGTSAKENSGNTISNNNIFDFLSKGTASNGINLGSFTTGETIQGNSFYETSSFTPSTGVAYNIINIGNTSGVNYSVTGNFIGGTSALCGGTAWTKLANPDNIFTAINLNVGTGTASNIQNNTIQKMSWSNSGVAGWTGINVTGGDVNIGTSTANTIGAATGVGSITVTNATTGANVYGINISSTGTVDCQNNIISSITVANAAANATNFYGISKTATGGNTTISNNTIGSTTTANSINSSSASTGNAQRVYGIYNAGTGTITISGNTVVNITNSTTNATATTYGFINGITATNGTNIITNNTIRNLTIANANTAGTSSAAVIGIVLTGTNGARTISGNTIYSLSNTFATFAGRVVGLYYEGNLVLRTNEVSKNFIHSLTTVGTSGASLFGIWIVSGVTTYSNNIINLGSANQNWIYGVYDTGAASQISNIYFNTIYIGGTVAAGAFNSYALYSAAANSTRNYENNIFFNARSRSAGTSAHFAIYFTAIGGALTIDYNDYYSSGTGWVLGYYGANRTTLAAWQTATAQDTYSLNSNPTFTSAGSTVATDYKIGVSLIGLSGTGITIDYGSVARGNPPTMGVWESNINKWKGSTSIDWNTPSNWTANVVPAVDATIVFDDIPLRHCQLDQDRSVTNIINAQGVYRMVTNGHKLTVKGNFNFTNGAQIDASSVSSNVELAGAWVQTIPAGIFYNNEVYDLTINNSNDVTLYGTMRLLHTITANSGRLNAYSTTPTVVYAGSSAQTIEKDRYLNDDIYNLTIDNVTGVALSATASIYIPHDLTITKGVLTVPPGATLTVDNYTKLDYRAPLPVVYPLQVDYWSCLVLKSNSTSTGSFVHSDLFTGIGTVKVERYMSNTNNWHLHSSPMKDESVHDFLKYNPEVPDLYDITVTPNVLMGVGMRDYYTATDKWSPYFIYANTSTAAGSIGKGKGFNIRTIKDYLGIAGTGTIDATGIPNPNSVTVTLTRTAATTDKGWNCIGNPFTTAINIQNSGSSGFLNAANISNLDPDFVAIYVWDTNNITTGHTTPEFIVINNATSISSVQTSQGFFVKSKTGGGSVSFTKLMQSPNSTLTFKDAVIEWPSIRIVAKNSALSSSTEIKFIPNTTQGLDPGWDAGMYKANPDFSLYSRLLVDNTVDYTLQCLPDQDFDKYVIPIGFDFKEGGELTFTAESINLPAGCQAVLEDRVTKRFTRLDLDGAKYTVMLDANTKGIGRFFLHTTDVISGDKPLENQPFKVYSTGKLVYIDGAVSTDAQFYLYSVNGKLLTNSRAESQVQNKLDASGYPAGVYLLTVIDKNQRKSVKFVLED